MGGFHAALRDSVAAAMDGDRAVEFDRLDLASPALAGGLAGALAGAFGKRFISIPSDTLSSLARVAFDRLAFSLRPSFVDYLARASRDESASPNERYVAAALLDNARIAANGVFPLCQDTGTAAVYAWKGDRVFVDHADDSGDDAVASSDDDALAAGARDAWTGGRLRNSQIAPATGGRESNTGDNGPLVAEIYGVRGDAYHFFFMAKGGGSSNKTALFQETKRILEPAAFAAFIEAAVAGLGASACPPYRIAMAFGGQTPEECVMAARLASAGALDALPRTPAPDGTPYRDAEAEAAIMASAERSGWGAQFGGRLMARDARVVRLARHAASFPVAVAVSCAAHRQAYARIDADGVWLERLADTAIIDTIAGGIASAETRGDTIAVNFPMVPALAKSLKAGDFVALHGFVVLARDAAHARLSSMIARGERLPEWTMLPVYYASPTGTPDGQAIGSLGPTTAKRMDSYMEELMSRGAFMVSIGKGERSRACRDACARHGGIYFAAVGGAAALAASRYVKSARVLDWEDLGMEAVRLVELDGLPALVAVDQSGRDFYEGLGGAASRQRT